jgi:hypothetical protein
MRGNKTAAEFYGHSAIFVRNTSQRNTIKYLPLIFQLNISHICLPCLKVVSTNIKYLWPIGTCTSFFVIWRGAQEYNKNSGECILKDFWQ